MNSTHSPQPLRAPRALFGLIGLVALAACAEEVDNDSLPPAQLPPAIDLERFDPQRYREDQLSLCGEWLFLRDPDGDGLERGLERPEAEALYTERIEVPFPWQSPLSGQGGELPERWAALGSERELDSYRGVAWYARWIERPAGWAPGGRVFLRFGAVDWAAELWLDGEPLGRHRGGFHPFELEIGERLEAGRPGFLVLRVEDPCDDGEGLLLGKQGGLWYRCVSGIWQDVLLERRPTQYISELYDAPAQEPPVLRSRVSWEGGGPVELRAAWLCDEELCGVACGPYYGRAEGASGDSELSVEVALPLDEVPAWTPERPCLLRRTLELRGTAGEVDRVLGYAALRDVELDWVPGHGPDDEVPREEQYRGFVVAGRQRIFRGVLDQAYHPEGIYSWPSREERRAELAQIKALGFDTVRIHLKPEPPWVYALCDALGLFVIYDLPSALDFAPSGAGAAWREPFLEMLDVLLARDRGHPSVLWWTVFNEAWGLLQPPFWQDEETMAWVRRAVERARALDPSRPVEDNSPGGLSEFLDEGALPHVDTDVRSYHLYARDPGRFGDALGELVEGSYPGSTQHVYGGGQQQGEPLIISEFGGLGALDLRGDAFHPLHGAMNLLWAQPRVRGWVVTQWSDLEWEVNGLVRFGREPKEAGLGELQMELRDLFSDPYLVLGEDPLRRARPGELTRWELGLGSQETMELGQVELLLLARDGSLETRLELPLPSSPGPGYLPLDTVELEAPSEPGVYRLLARALDEGAQVQAQNGAYLWVEPEPRPALPPGALEGATLAAEDATEDLEGRSVRCPGRCGLEFVLPAPGGAGRYELKLEAELASFDPDFRQTDGSLRPSSLEILVDGVRRGELELADAPHDHRGVLSLLSEGGGLYGGYGVWETLDLGTVELGDSVRLRLVAEPNGVQLFFRHAGAWPRDPRLRMERVSD